MINTIKKLNNPLTIKILIIIILLVSVFLLTDTGMSIVKNNISSKSDLEIKSSEITPPQIVTYPEYMQKLKKLFSTSSQTDKDAAGKKFELISIINSGSWNKIKLNGTLINDNVSLAILQADDKNYAVTKGESLGDYRVIDVTRSTVTFEGEGEKKTIMVNYTGEAVSPTEESSLSGKTLKREELNALLEPPDRLAKEATFMPVQDGGISGVKLSYLKDGSLLQKVGLMQNDILLEVNGESLKSGNDIFKAYQVFRNEDDISIKLKRGGKDINVKLEVK